MVIYPKDWDMTELGTKCEVTSSKRVFESEWKNAGIPFLRTRDIASFHAGTEQKDKLFISESTYYEKVKASGEPCIGDLLVTGVGTIGLPYLVNRVPMYFKDGNILWVKRSESFEPQFLYLLFLSNEIKQQIIDGSGFTTVGTFTIKNAKKLRLPCPEKNEQKVIADTLSCIDTHIANLTELIEKKKAIRDAALEDILSGGTRLVGFSGEWEEYSFDDFFTLLPNNTLSREKLSERGTIGNIHYGDVLIKYHNNVTDKDEIPRIKADIDTRSFRLLQSGDIIIADTAEDETVGKAIQICDVSMPLVGGLHTIVCRPNYDTALGYLGYYINSKNYHNQLFPHITGIKVSSISKKAIKTTVLNLPKDIDEQKAIVEVLTSLDAEIASFEEEKDKMLQIKAGAMDDLLTGRVRLVRQGG